MRITTNKKRRIYLLLATVVAVLASAIWWISIGSEKASGRTATIAVIGPLTGPNQEAGIAMQRAVQMAADAFNNTDVASQDRIRIVAFDDRNDSERAREMAERAFADSNVLGVVGHNYSSSSLAASEVYKSGLVSISPTSTANALTADNPWFFRAIFDNSTQSGFLANYIKSTLSAQPVVIVKSSSPYGEDLARAFVEQAGRVGVPIAAQIEIGSSVPMTARQVGARIASIDGEPLVFLALQREEAKEIIREIRDQQLPNRLLAADALSTNALKDDFADYPRSREDPGFYVRGLLAVTPFLPEISNQQAQSFLALYQDSFDDEPPWAAPFAYDSARLLIDAIGAANGFDPSIKLTERRERVRQHLARLDSPGRSLPGVTGVTYFDAHGDAVKPITVGTFDATLVSAMTQLRAVPPYYSRNRIEQLRDKDLLTELGEHTLIKTAIAYTGISIDKISNLDLETQTAEIDFRIWFRYKSSLPVFEVEFVNAISSIDMGAPLKITEQNGVSYRLYEGSGQFKLDFAERRAPFGRHMVGLGIRHRSLEHDQLVFVPDTMSLTAIHGSQLVHQLQADQVISQGLGWNIQRAWIYQTIDQRPTRGDPDHMLGARETYPQSRISFIAEISRDEISIRRQFLSENQGILVIALMASMIAVVLSINHPRLRPYRNFFTIFQFIIGLILMLVAEGVVLDEMISTLNADQKSLRFVVRVFDILWWIVPMFFVIISIGKFIWTPLEKATDRTIPAVAKNFVNTIVITLTGFGIIAFVFDEKITSLLATSGLIVMIIGLAIQVNIANVFSGIALNIERPFQIGDWVEIGDTPIGKVTDVSWRSTKIRTRTGSYLSVPNSKASDSIIRNFTYPNQEQEIHRFVHIDRHHRPERVCKILKDAIFAAPTAPGTRILSGDAEFVGVVDWAAKYEMIVTVDNMDEMDLQMSLVMTAVWAGLNRFGITQITQRQDVYFHRPQPILEDSGDPTAPLPVLQGVSVFEPFSDEDKAYLASVISPKWFDEGEDIMIQAEPGDSMFLVFDGTISVIINTPNGELEVARLGPGAFLGEMAMLSGEPRSATVRALTRAGAYEVSKSDIAPLIERNPEVLSELSEVVANRQMETKRKSMEASKFDRERKSLAKRLANAMRNFFSSDNSDTADNDSSEAAAD